MAPPPPRPKHPNLSTYHLMVILLLASTTSTTAASTYSTACPSLAPAADRHTDADDAHSLAGSIQIYNGQFFGSAREDAIFSFDDDQLHNSFSLFPHRVARTSDPALVHLAATLELAGPRSRRPGRNHTTNAHVSFVLDVDGYYSSDSLELCMVGSTSTSSGTTTDVVVLRLRVPSPPRLDDPFVTGTLEGSSELGAIQLLVYAQGEDYEYADSGRGATCSPPTAPPLQPLGVGGDLPACAHLVDQLVTSYRLLPQDYNHGRGAPARLPRRMHVTQAHCTADGAVRAYVVFSNGHTEWRAYHGFMVGDESAVAEGRWDTEQGMLCLRACRVVRSAVPSPTLAVGECGIGMSFWFPAVWTVQDRSVVAGMLWNTSTGAGKDISGVNVVSAFSIDDPAAYHRRNLSDVRYEYNDEMIEEAKKHYQTIIKNEKKKMRKGTFPVPGNSDTYHDFSLKFFGGGDGEAYPVSIGSVMMSEDALAAAAAVEDPFPRYDIDMAGPKHGLLSVSYDIHHHAPERDHNPPLERQQIKAEGVYDAESGVLCMVGCREHNGSTDCRVLVTAQFPSMDDSTMGGGPGAISSLRERSDRLFFETTDIALHGMYWRQASEAVSRMDIESVMLAASATLSCVFAAAQILHTKRNLPEAAPATSVTMLAVLALGHLLAPVALGFEAVFASRRSRYGLADDDSDGWLDLNQVMVNLPALLAFVLHLRLLQLVFSGRRRMRPAAVNQSKEQLVTATSEWAVLKICLPLYLLGAVLAAIAHAAHLGGVPATLGEDLVSYTGLIVDGFLLPQIILNASSSGGSAVVRAISPWFYMGGTVIRVMPHLYDVVRRQAYVPSMIPSELYASGRGDLFGVAWDVVVPCGAASMALVLFWQQRIGGVGGASGQWGPPAHSER